MAYFFEYYYARLHWLDNGLFELLLIYVCYTSCSIETDNIFANHLSIRQLQFIIQSSALPPRIFLLSIMKVDAEKGQVPTHEDSELNGSVGFFDSRIDAVKRRVYFQWARTGKLQNH